MKIGQKFKFIINNGERYLSSSYYPEVNDGSGNTNNIYNPSQLNWINSKKLKARQNKNQAHKKQQQSSQTPGNSDFFDNIFNNDDSVNTKSTRESTSQSNTMY